MFKAQSLAQEKYTAYKCSGVDWLYEIPSHWKVVRFKFLSSITTGNKNTEDKLDAGAYPFYVRSQTPELIDSYSFDGEAILTAGDGAGVGKVYHYVNGKFDFHQRVYKFSDFKHAAGKFLFRYLESNFFKVATLGEAKSTVDSLRLPLIQDFLVCFPENKTEQASIVKFVDLKSEQIDQAILVKERQIELLKERKQILIQQAVTRGLDPDAPMQDSGIEWIGEIPAHWSIKRAKYLFREVDERSPDGQQELLSVSHLTGVTPRSEKNVTMFMSEDYTGSKTCQKDDLIFNIMWAWMGALGVSDRAGIVSSAYGIYRQLHPDTLNSQYLEMLLKTTAYIAHYNKVSTGLHSSRLRFYGHMFMAMEVGFPDREEQDEIVAHLDLESGKLNKAVDLLEQQITKLKEYKATLINSAVTGKIKVPGVVEPATQDRGVA
jgi:type I restriction enzyme S subunit